MSRNRRIKLSLQRQRGFLIPLALFILVGMLALAVSISRITGQSATSATLEGLSTQAFYAAESGGQFGMHQLFFNAANRTAVDTRCAGLNTTLNFPAPGLQVCSSTITCQADAQDTDSDGMVDTSFYTVTSAGSCGAGDMSAQRTIEISAYMQ